MFKLTVFFILALSLSGSEAHKRFLNNQYVPPQGMQCGFFNEIASYDFGPLTNPSHDYKLQDVQHGDEYIFNFCKYTSNPCNQSANFTYAYKQKMTTGKECEFLTDVISGAQVQSAITQLQFDNGTTIFDQQIVTFTQGGGYLCEGEPAKITYEILCDKNGNASVLPDEKKMALNTSNKCHPTVTFSHNAGCSKYIMEASGWSHDPLEEARILYATNYQLYMFQQVVAIILGLFLTFKGRYRANEIIGIAFGYTTFILVLAYLYNNTAMDNTAYIPAILAGIIVGYLAYQNLADLFVATIGALVGCILALVIISVFRIDNDLIVYLLIGVGIFIGFTGHFMTSQIELFLCVLTGAYLIVEGLTTFLGGLPSYMTGIQTLLQGDSTYFVETILYTAVFLAIAFFGFTYQQKH